MPAVNVKVVPGSKSNRVVGKYGDGIKIQVSAPAEDGKANAAVVRVLAAALGLKPAQVEVTHGHSQPRKVIKVEGIEPGDLAAWIAKLS